MKQALLSVAIELALAANVVTLLAIAVLTVHMISENSLG